MRCEGYREILGGEAASLREAPLPPDPSLPKSGWRLAGLFFLLGSAWKLGMSPMCLCESTAADRAAADMRRVGMLKLRWRLPSEFFVPERKCVLVLLCKGRSFY